MSDRRLGSHTAGRACFLCCRFGRGKTHLEIAVLQQRAAWGAEAAATRKSHGAAVGKEKTG